jgi:glycosyltransferase involved in cell wall biosynthesis
MDRKSLVVAAIPAYNEERTIARVVLLARRHVDRVVVCDDGSMDMTAEIAEKLGAMVVRHHKNMGKGVALKTALEYLKQLNPDIVVTMDADGQHDPEGIPRLLEPIIRGEADMVIGSRYVEGSETDAPFYRRLGLKLVNSVSRKSGRGVVRDTQSGFRAYSAKVLDLMRQCEAEGYGIETEQLAVAVKNGLRVVEVPITVRYKGLEKTSKRNPVGHGAELVGMALRLIVEERPLLLLGVPGALLTVLGIGTGVYLLWYFNMTRYFSIPVALITLGALFIGTILFITSLMLYAITRLKQKTTKQ